MKNDPHKKNQADSRCIHNTGELLEPKPFDKGDTSVMTLV
ncbi:hypothetical protein HM1_2005 [Heliomicrobium modesticaldum Ice1]|uniref:Uncharacterized protein n=1 Tax=Heliobacterium modesticaldum (strain ATCC 51547 / Ice1) TaxID=498761 RepID=B0TG66_HELMI|nr:hypothetical protein HM1_2005 [Heliomicrobium modesticaldum Ice1]